MRLIWIVGASLMTVAAMLVAAGLVRTAPGLVSVPVGVATAVAVVAHGYSFPRAVALDAVVSLSTPLGGILAYAALDVVDGAVPYVLALAAAGFIYIAAADLIPALHRRAALTAGVSQVVLIVAGIGTIAVLEWVHP